MPTNKNIIIMKKLTLLLLTVLCVSFYCNANESEPVSLPPDLIPVTLNGKLLKQPRGIGELPVIDCYYYDGKLYIETADYLENVRVSVTNTITGEQYVAYGVDIFYSFVLDTSYIEGEYYVEIESSSMMMYGYYNL